MSKRNVLLMASGLAIVLSGLPAPAESQKTAKLDVLNIGTPSSVMDNVKADQRKTARDTLKDFIKKETGFNNEIVTLKDYKEVVQQLAAHKIQLGLLGGTELAWALTKNPRIKPLAIAINEHPYGYVYIVTRANNKAKDFGGLQGESITVPSGPPHVRFFLEREAKAGGKDLKTFFSKVAAPDNVEDALDDVVDGVVDVAAVDLVSLEAYKGRKPGRFARLREVLHSPPFPPATIIYEEGALDNGTLDRFRDGLVSAKNKEQGKMLLSIYKLTSFEPVPKDFEHMLQDTVERFPPTAKQ